MPDRQSLDVCHYVNNVIWLTFKNLDVTKPANQHIAHVHTYEYISVISLTALHMDITHTKQKQAMCWFVIVYFLIISSAYFHVFAFLFISDRDKEQQCCLFDALTFSSALSKISNTENLQALSQQSLIMQQKSGAYISVCKVSPSLSCRFEKLKS